MLGEGLPCARHLREAASPTETVTFLGFIVNEGRSDLKLKQLYVNELKSK